MTTHKSIDVRIKEALEQNLPKHLQGEFTPLERSPSAGPSEFARINGANITATTQDIRNAIITSLAETGVDLRQIFENGTDVWSLTMTLEDTEGFAQIVVTYKQESHELITSVLSGIPSSTDNT